MHFIQKLIELEYGVEKPTGIYGTKQPNID